MPNSALENEATGAETTTFEHFGREWTVPAQRHLSHLRRLRDEMRRGFANIDLILAETFLAEADLIELARIDPDEEALSAFGSEIAKAMGFGNSGNSSSS